MFNQTIVRLRAPHRTNRGGESVPDWTSASIDRLTISGVSVQPSSSSESATAQYTLRVTRYRVFTAPGNSPDVEALDRIEFNGETYDVDGEVSSWRNPFSDTRHHIEFAITRNEGA